MLALNLRRELLKFTLKIWLSSATASYKFKGALAQRRVKFKRDLYRLRCKKGAGSA